MARVIKTLARQAQDELLDETNNSVLLQTPFMTSGYQLIPARLETTLSEIDILEGTQAIARSGFEQNDAEKTIVIPTIFAKVDGLLEVEKPYWNKLDKIRDTDGLQALVSIHFDTSEFFLTEEDFAELQQSLTIDTIKHSNGWAYGMLSALLELRIATAIVDLMNDWPFTFENNAENQRYVLSVLLDLPKELLDMCLEVDYPKEVPLLAFIHQESIGQVTKEDVIAMTMFHYLGWDVVLYTPNGFSSFEHYLSSDMYDHFTYAKMASTDSAKGDPKPGLFRKIFG